MSDRAAAALAALAAQPGYEWGVVGRSADDPALWLITSRWRRVGDYRRALSAWDVKMTAHPVLYEALDEPTAFEVLREVAPGGRVTTFPSDRSAP